MDTGPSKISDPAIWIFYSWLRTILYYGVLIVQNTLRQCQILLGI